MAKKRSADKAGTKSDVIRAILKEHPKATVKEIQSELTSRGVKASVALVNKVKYGRGSSKKKAGRRSHAGKLSKASAIRAAWEKLGHSARPRDVIAALAARGVAVSSAQVSMLRKSLLGNGRSEAASSAMSVSLDHLLAAKALAHRLGGIEPARQALASLAKLMEN